MPASKKFRPVSGVVRGSGQRNGQALKKSVSGLKRRIRLFVAGSGIADEIEELAGEHGRQEGFVFKLGSDRPQLSHAAFSLAAKTK